MKRDCAAWRDETDAASHAERSVYTPKSKGENAETSVLGSASLAREREGPPHPWFPVVKRTNGRFERALVEQMGVLGRRS